MASNINRCLLLFLFLIPLISFTESVVEFTKFETLAPVYELNLDSPAQDRWLPILGQVDALLLKAHIEATVLKLLQNQVVQTFSTMIAESVADLIDQEYREEMEGISNFLGLDLGNVIIYNFFYDLVSRSEEVPANTKRSSTSIVTMCKNNGIMHAQNVEADDVEYLKTITVNIDFKRGGQIVYTGTTFVGLIGLQNAFKPDSFSMSVNERNSGTLFDVLFCALRNGNPMFVVSRQIMETARNFEDAITRLTREKAIAPYYFILGGTAPREGAVVVGNRGSVAGVAFMTSTLEYRWYVIQTNYDPWTTPPATDNRRALAAAAMDSYGRRRMTPPRLLDVTSTPVVLSSDTVFTTIMAGCRRDVFRTVIR